MSKFGPEWAYQDWSYEAEKERLACIPLTPIVWVECCRIWPVVPGYRVGTCGICGTVPVPCVGGSSIARNVAELFEEDMPNDDIV